MTKAEITKLDKAWADKIKARANWRCEYCHVLCVNHGGTHWLNACHIIGRRYRGTRWDVNNGMSMCYVHHAQYDNHGPQHEDIMREVVKGRYAELKQKANQIAKNQDYKSIMQEITSG
jgi:hypothetical protein